MTEPNDTFNYLAVLFSIILGLAVTEILQGLRRLMLRRRTTKLYWPALLWAITLLVILAQSWWAMFGLRAHLQWTFGMYGIVLLQCAVLYLVAGLSLAGLEDESAGDMKRAYFDNARAFFLLLTGVLAISLLKDVVIQGHLPGPANVAFHAIYALGALIAAVTRKPWVHEAYAPLAALAFAAYIVVLFDRLA
ncbi:hypothetical protein [Dokdonella immobilis]|uniref:Uncharacterized protein n=1 Tax=Dokdonella immobilis TaxID=578942 RepID=A0A1I5B3G5_9GAMM|nr:hypothetical protein [Dokdonella immobilis]SFN69235.1 hypothetical protein SAMN05216289_1502 [Dokdonella immobilis]